MSYPAYPQPVIPTVPPHPGVGIVAFIASAAAFVLGGAGVWLSGFMVGRLVRMTEIPELAMGLQDEGWVLLQDQLWAVVDRAVGAFVVLAIAWILHMLLAGWGLVQGIVAAAMNRGRVWGVIAVVLALLGWTVLAWFTQDALLAGLMGNVPFLG